MCYLNKIKSQSSVWHYWCFVKVYVSLCKRIHQFTYYYMVISIGYKLKSAHWPLTVKNVDISSIQTYITKLLSDYQN